MTDKTLTDKQRQIFEYIAQTIETRGYPPSIRDIGQAFNIKSPNGVMCHLKALQKKGMVKRVDKQARAITIDGVNSGGSTLPLLGLVAAGPTIEAVPTDERIDLSSLFTGKEVFALKVKGQSMIDDHIDEGDIVIVRRQSTAENGERVVAMIDGATTLKKFYSRKEGIVLEPCNSSMQPIVVSPESEVQVVGVLVGVVRKC